VNCYELAQNGSHSDWSTLVFHDNRGFPDRYNLLEFVNKKACLRHWGGWGNLLKVQPWGWVIRVGRENTINHDNRHEVMGTNTVRREARRGIQPAAYSSLCQHKKLYPSLSKLSFSQRRITLQAPGASKQPQLDFSNILFSKIPYFTISQFHNEYNLLLMYKSHVLRFLTV
jgi:hypothetical protein